jgi:hypothetical protein
LRGFAAVLFAVTVGVVLTAAAPAYADAPDPTSPDPASPRNETSVILQTGAPIQDATSDLSRVSTEVTPVRGPTEYRLMFGMGPVTKGSGDIDGAVIVAVVGLGIIGLGIPVAIAGGAIYAASGGPGPVRETGEYVAGVGGAMCGLGLMVALYPIWSAVLAGSRAQGPNRLYFAGASVTPTTTGSGAVVGLTFSF